MWKEHTIVLNKIVKEIVKKEVKDEGDKTEAIGISCVTYDVQCKQNEKFLPLEEMKEEKLDEEG